MHDFWTASGHHLLDRDANGWLRVTDAFLAAYLRRPEMLPPEDACGAERALHAQLLDDPRRPVYAAELAAIADADAQENLQVWLAFRDRLLAAGTLEGCYLALFRDGVRGVPSLFVDHLVHAILRAALDGTPSGLRARAGELLFREQTVSLDDGRLRLADSETLASLAGGGGAVELDILDEASHQLYWDRDGRHDLVLDVSFGAAGLDALCRVLERWIAHVLAVSVVVQPVQRIRDERWVWHVGLDAEASSILNDLYGGAEVAEERLARVLSLFRLEFADPAAMRADIAGRPVYLAMAMTPDRRLRLKPQNLLLNLPLAQAS